MAKTKYTAAQRRAYAARMKKSKTRYGKKPATRSRRQAYKPSVKKATVRSLMPLAEGRKRTFVDFDTNYLAVEWNVNIPKSSQVWARENAYESQSQQLTSNGFTGNTLFMRYINAHYQLSFETIRLNAQPVVMRVLYGWCKAPYQQPLLASGNAARMNTNGVRYVWNPDTFVEQKLKEVFDNNLPVNDPKVFKLKHNRQYYLGGKTIQTNVPGSGPGTTETQLQTLRQKMDFYPKWSPQRKFHMIPVQFGVSTTVKPDEYDFTNYQDGAYWTPDPSNNKELWIPFFAIRIQNIGEYGVKPDGSTDITSYPKIINKDTTYFLDL